MYLEVGPTQVRPAFLFITQRKGTFMKRLIIIALCVLITGNIGFAQKKGTPKTKKEKVSYSIGISIGRNFKNQGVEIDQAAFTQGVKDALKGSKTALTEMDMENTMSAFQEEMMAKVEAQNKVKLDEGKAFLEANKNKEGVITLPSGLQYKVIKSGDGPKPTKDQTVSCHYRGTLLDGTEFDSSYKRGQPTEFPVGGVIKGWTEALQLMPVGSKWQLFIPSDLAYGPNGAGGMIGPNATLIFEVELISIK